ncbi:unnamed protein product [Parnassius apollo]|uniref:(apollo) hypothetical protein n=1 Tax=Parnassius apollo TaxID=110799 RepID=A0A8S3XAI0_PARAO|nr:unnamed protein product [Parnassius apollo]
MRRRVSSCASSPTTRSSPSPSDSTHTHLINNTQRGGAASPRAPRPPPRAPASRPTTLRTHISSTIHNEAAPRLLVRLVPHHALQPIAQRLYAHTSHQQYTTRRRRVSSCASSPTTRSSPSPSDSMHTHLINNTQRGGAASPREPRPPPRAPARRPATLRTHISSTIHNEAAPRLLVRLVPHHALQPVAQRLYAHTSHQQYTTRRRRVSSCASSPTTRSSPSPSDSTHTHLINNTQRGGAASPRAPRPPPHAPAHRPATLRTHISSTIHNEAAPRLLVRLVPHHTLQPVAQRLYAHTSHQQYTTRRRRVSS